jgi:hypothetical protein
MVGDEMENPFFGTAPAGTQQMTLVSGYNWPKYLILNPNWHELRKQKKCSSLVPPKSKFYKTQWAWQAVKLTWLMSIINS